VSDPGFERGRMCRCGHYHFHINACTDRLCECKRFVDPRPKKAAEASAAAAGLPPYPAQETLVQRCGSCGAAIVWGVHNGKSMPLDHPPQRAWAPVRRGRARFLVVSCEVYHSHLITCGNADNHKGRAGHESGPE
jgi:hypothetical protein